MYVLAFLVQVAGRVQKHQRRFGAMTQDLQELGNWLRQFDVAQVAMESSGRMDCAAAATWSPAAQLRALRNHPRFTRPNENASESIARSFAYQQPSPEGA